MSRRPGAPAIRDRRPPGTGRGTGIQSRSSFPGAQYDGARGDLRELAEWFTRAGSANSDTLGALETLRSRSRDLARNAPVAASARQTSALGVVGAGLHPMPRIDHELLGLNEEGKKKFEDAAKRIWWAWSHGTPCDVERKHLFPALQQQAFVGAWESGDCFVLRRHLQRPRDLLSLKLQLIEADRCSTPDNKTVSPNFFDGVELDEDGAVVAFHFSEEHPGDLFLRSRNGGRKIWRRVPAYDESGERLVLHVTCWSAIARIGQMRGVPALAPAIKIFKQIDRYTNAELMAAVISAMFTVFIKNASPAPDGATGLAPLDDTEVPSNQIKLEAGGILELLQGQSIETANPGRPNAQFGPFVVSMLEQVGTSIGIPYEVLIRHFTASYSASRAAIEMAWMAFRVARSMYVDEFAQPVYEWVMTEAILAGKLDAPGFFTDPLRRMAYLRTEWSGPTAPQVDPLKEAAAAEKRIKARLSTHERENAQLNGGDWDETIAQLGKERAEIVRLNLHGDVDDAPPDVEVDTDDDDDTDLETAPPTPPTTDQFDG